MIPGLVNIGGPWAVLPPGIHTATLAEIEDEFATNARRQALFSGFKRGAAALVHAHCSVLFLDGSFVTDKGLPGDYDVCWSVSGVDVSRLDPVMLDFSHGRAAQKQKYGGEFFPVGAMADGVSSFFEYFQVDTFTGKRKGILEVRLHPTAAIGDWP